MSMHRLHPEPEDDDPVSSRSGDSGETRPKAGDIGAEMTPSTTMTTDGGSLSTTKSNCSSPGSDFHNHPHYGHRRLTGDHDMGGRRQAHSKEERATPGEVETKILTHPDYPRPLAPPPVPATRQPHTNNLHDGAPDRPPTDAPPGDGLAKYPAAPTLDETDRASVYSLFMERDFRYYFQHPYLRLGIAYLVTFLNFFIYAEDPVSHSERECFIPVVGNCFSFVCTKYPRNGWAVLKVIMWLIAIITGLFIGKLLIHGIVFRRLFKLKMFLDDRGSWMTMFFTVIFSLFIFSHLYNLVLMIGGDSTLPYRITDKMGVRNSFFMKAAACGTWSGDFFTAWMVTDMMLQEKLYPQWAKLPRKWWNYGVNRIVLFWFMVLSTSSVVVMVISTDWIDWDRLNHGFVATTELSRAFLASFILVMDLLIVMQDWDFPHFVNSMDIKLPGINAAHIKFKIPTFLRKEEGWSVHITGKWFNYGLIFMVMILDLNMWKNQMFYSPYEYGQYIGPEKKIHTVHDSYTLATHNRTMLSYDWRSTVVYNGTNTTLIQSDMVMNSKYLGYKLSAKGMAFLPSLLAFVCFGFLIWYFGRVVPTETDHYAGRLKKRKKRLSLSQRIQQSWLRRKRASATRETVNGSSNVNLVRLKGQGDASPKVIFDSSEPDYEPLTSIVEENGAKKDTPVKEPRRLTAPLATPEKV